MSGLNNFISLWGSSYNLYGLHEVSCGFILLKHMGWVVLRPFQTHSEMEKIILKDVKSWILELCPSNWIQNEALNFDDPRPIFSSHLKTFLNANKLTCFSTQYEAPTRVPNGPAYPRQSSVDNANS